MNNQAQEPQEITQLLDDFRYLKNAVMKNWVFKFLSPYALRPLYLLTGLTVIVFCGIMGLLSRYFGSYHAIPGSIKSVYYTGLALTTLWLSYSKLNLFLKNLREMGSDITITQFLKGVYTWSTMTVAVPYLVATVLAVLFLVTRGLSGYLIPCLAILYGLMLNAMLSIVYWREMAVGAIWILITGFADLFILGPSHPLLGITVTFGLGFLAMYIASWILATRDAK